MAIGGIDDSTYQGKPDYDAFIRAGGTFALSKVSEGVGFEDPRWSYNGPALDRRKQALVPGAYHFARPDLGNTPEAEARWFWSRLIARVDPRGWLGVLDLEVGNGPLGDWRDRFCSELSALAGGAPVGWYSYHDFIGHHALNYASTFWAWVAWPDSNGPMHAYNFEVSMQQYGAQPVAGFSGDVDVDRFFGDVAQLRALTIGNMPSGPGRGGDTAAPAAGGGEGSMVTITGADGRIHRLIVEDLGQQDAQGNRGGPVAWGAFAGGTGGIDGWTGGDGDLPGGGGWVAAGTLSATLWTWPAAPLAAGGTGPRELLIVHGRGLDAALWRKALYTDDFTVQSPWAHAAGPVPAIPGQAPVPGPQGPSGPPGPAMDEAQVRALAADEIQRRLTNG